jgi:hypothetical protein
LFFMVVGFLHQRCHVVSIAWNGPLLCETHHGRPSSDTVFGARCICAMRGGCQRDAHEQNNIIGSSVTREASMLLNQQLSVAIRRVPAVPHFPARPEKCMICPLHYFGATWLPRLRQSMHHASGCYRRRSAKAREGCAYCVTGCLNFGRDKRRGAACCRWHLLSKLVVTMRVLSRV